MTVRTPIASAALIVATGLASVTLSSCSSPPEALQGPACSLITPASVEYALSVKGVHTVVNQAGHCTYAGTGSGSDSRLTFEIYRGDDAMDLPHGVKGKVYGPDPVGHVQTYWIPLTTSTGASLVAFNTGILSGSKDGYVVRVTATRRADALTGARLGLEALLPHL